MINQQSMMDEYTEEFVAQFMQDIDLIRQDFKIKNIKYKPQVMAGTSKSSQNRNLNLTRIKPFFQSSVNAKFDEKLSANITKSSLHTSSYKSFNPKIILQQFERGEIKRLSHEVPTLKHSRRQSQQTYTGHNTHMHTHSNLKFKVISVEELSRSPSMVPEQSQISISQKNNYKLEPLSKYDEGRIKYYERDQEIINKLNNKIPVTGYTRFKQDSVEEWVSCEILRCENSTYLVYIPTLGKKKLVTRSNMLLEDENREEFIQRFQQAKHNRYQTLYGQEIKRYIDTMAQKEEVLLTKDIINRVVHLQSNIVIPSVFDNSAMAPFKSSHYTQVVEETMENYKESVFRFEVFRKLDFDLQVPVMPTQLRLVDVQFSQKVHLLENHYNHVGAIPQLKQKEKMEILRVISKVMEFTYFAVDFRLFNDLKKLLSNTITNGGEQLIEVFSTEFQQNISKLDMFIYKIESALDKLKSHIINQLNAQNSASILVNPPDHNLHIKRFETLCLNTFNQVLSSFLHLSIKKSFDDFLFAFNNFSSSKNSDIDQTPLFNNSPSFMKQDLALILENYVQLQQDTEGNRGYLYEFPQQLALGHTPFIELKFKLTQNKKKIKHHNIIRYVLQQRNKIYQASHNLKLLQTDIFRDNWDDCPTRPSSKPQKVATCRLGWYSWKRLKVTLHPSLGEIEDAMKKSIKDQMTALLAQNALGQYVTQQKLSISDTIYLLDKFEDYINQFFYELYIRIIPISILVNQYHFYLSESSFITQLIGIYEATNNNVLVGQERKNLSHDLHFIEHQLPNSITVGIFRISLTSFKETVTASIRQGIVQLDAAMQKHIETVMVENAKLHKQISDFLNEVPTSVHQYIETMQYIQCKELELQLNKIKDNQDLADKTLSIITQFQGLVSCSEQVYFKYLNQLAMVHTIERHKQQTIKHLDSQREHFKRLIDETTDQLKRRFKKLYEEIRDFSLESELSKASLNLLQAKAIEEQLTEVITRSKEINEQETFLGYESTNFAYFQTEQVKFQKFSDLWELAEKIRYVEVYDMIESSRDYSYQLFMLMKQFEDSVFKTIIEQLSQSITKYEAYFQSLLVLKEITLRERYYERVMMKLFNAKSMLELQQITIPDLIDRNLDSLQDYIIEQSLLAKKEQQVTQQMNDLELQFKEIQFKSVNVEISETAFPIVINTTSILNTLKEIELEINNFRHNQTYQLQQAIQDRCLFLELTCSHTQKILEKIFFIQEILMTFAKPFPEYAKLKDEHKKRIENVKRLGLLYFQQIFDKGEPQIEQNFVSEEVTLLKTKLQQSEEVCQEIAKRFAKEMEIFRYKNSRISFLSPVEVASFFYDLYNPVAIQTFLMSLFPNIKSFQLSNNPQQLQILSLQSYYEEDIFIQEDLKLQWQPEAVINPSTTSSKPTTQEHNFKQLFNMVEVIERTYQVYLRQNIYGYLPMVVECNYNISKVFKFVQQHSLTFQALYLLIQLQFYHDLTLMLYSSYSAIPCLSNLRSHITEQLDQFTKQQTSKNRKSFSPIQYQMYNQLILLVLHLLDIVASFLAPDQSSDQYFSSKSLQSFEYLTLPKFSLEAVGLDASIIRETVEEFDRTQMGITPRGEQHSSYLRTMLGAQPKVCMVSLMHKQYYGFELQGMMDLIMVTPAMQRSYFSLLSLLNEPTGVFFQGHGRTITITSFCTLLAKPVWHVNDDRHASHLIGCLLQRGVWALCSSQLAQLSSILVSIRNELKSGKDTVCIEGFNYSINPDFRVLGVLSPTINPAHIESYHVIQLVRHDDRHLLNAFSNLLGIGVATVNKFEEFWEHVKLVFRVFENREGLPPLSIILKQALKGYREYITQQDLKQTAYMVQYFEMVGDCLPLEQKKLLVSLVEDQFKEDTMTLNDERNLQLKQQAEYAREYLQSIRMLPNQRILAQLCAFFDHFDRTLTIVGKHPKLIVEVAAFVHSKLKNAEFQLIFFPLYTISIDDLLGHYKEEQWQPGLVELAVASSQIPLIDENDAIQHYHSKRLLNQQLITQNCRKQTKRRIPFSGNDWFIFDNPAGGLDLPTVTLGSGQRLAIPNPCIKLLDNLHCMTPQPLDNYIICEEVFEQQELFLQLIQKLVSKHPFFEKIKALLKALYYFIGHYLLDRNTIMNFTKLLCTLLNEHRKNHIANGSFNYNDFRAEERKFIFDPSQLFNPEVIEALFVMALTYSIKPFIETDRHKILTINIIERIEKYQEFQSHQTPFGCNLPDELRRMGLNLFQVYFDSYECRWKGDPELTTQACRLLFCQKKLDSNILTAFEVVRLNPNSLNINQVRGQYASDVALLTDRSLDFEMSYDHYLIILMALSGSKIFVQDHSFRPVSRVFTKILEMHKYNQIVRMDTNRSLGNLAERIKAKANFIKQYATNLENRLLTTNIIIEDMNMAEPSTQFLRSLLVYQAVLTGDQVLRCKSYRFLSSSKDADIPDYIKDTCFVGSLKKEGPVLLYTIFKGKSEPFQHMVLANLKYELGDLVPSFIQVLDDPVRFCKFYRSIYPVKPSQYDDMRRFHHIARNFYNQQKQIARAYGGVLQYDGYLQLSDDEFSSTIKLFKAELDAWMLQFPSRREVSLIVGKLILHTMYAHSHEFKELERTFKDATPDITIKFEKVWDLISKDNQSVLELSLERLQRLNEIFILVNAFVPYVFLKPNMNFTTVTAALSLLSQLNSWQSLSMDLSKCSSEEFASALNAFIQRSNSSKILLLKVQSDYSQALKYLTDKIDEIEIDGTESHQLRIVIVYHLRPQIKHFKHRFQVSKSLPQSPTLYEMHYGKHYNRQSQEQDEMIDKNSRAQVYRILYEMETYFYQVEERFQQNSLYSSVLAQCLDKIKVYSQMEDKLENELHFLRTEEQKLQGEREMYQGQIVTNQNAIVDYTAHLEQAQLAIENCVAARAQFEDQSQQRYVALVQHLLSLKNYYNLSVLKDSSVNCLIYHQFILHFAFEKKLDKLRNEDHFNHTRSVRHNEFLQCMASEQAKVRLRNLLNVSLATLGRDTREVFTTSLQYSQLLDPDMMRSDVSEAVHNIVELFLGFLVAQLDHQHQYTQCGEELSEIKDMLKKTQVDLRLTKDHIIYSDKKLITFQNQIESVNNRMKRINEHAALLERISQAIRTDVWKSYTANKFYIDLDRKSQCCFNMALYVVQQATEQKVQIQKEQLTTIPFTLQQQGLYYRLFKEIDQADALVIDKLCIINFFIQIRLPFLAVFDDSQFVRRMLDLEQHVYSIVHYPQHLPAQHKGMLVAVNPSPEFLTEAAQLLTSIVETRSKYYHMEKLFSAVPLQAKRKTQVRSSRNITIPTKATIKTDKPEQPQDFYLLIIYTEKPVRPPKEFIHITLNEQPSSSLPSSHQRLLDIFVHTFKRKELGILIESHQRDQSQTLLQQEASINELLFLLKSCEPSSEEFMPQLYRFSFEGFRTGFNEICVSLHQQRQAIYREIYESPQYQSLNVMGPATTLTIPEEGEDSASELASPHESDAEAEREDEPLQPLRRDTKLQFERFMNVGYLKEQYFYPIKSMQLLTFPFLEMTGFLIYMKQLLSKVAKQIDVLATSDHFYWLAIRETMQKIIVYCGANFMAKPEHATQFIRLWFMQIVCALPTKYQNLIYYLVSMKYLKLKGELHPFLNEIFVHGYQHPIVSGVTMELQERHFREKLILRPSVFAVQKIGEESSLPTLLERRVGPINAQNRLTRADSVSEPMLVRRKSSIQEFRRISQHYMPRQSALFSLFNNDEDLLQNIDKEELERVYLKQIMFNLNNNNTQLRASVIQDQSEFHFFSQNFQRQLQRLSTTMRLSHTQQLQNQISLALVNLRSSYIGIKNIMKQRVSLIKSLNDLEYPEQDFREKQKHVLADIDTHLQHYKLMYYPKDVHLTMANLVPLLNKSVVLRSIFNDLLSHIDEQKWLNFALTPISSLVQQLSDYKVPLPQSVDTAKIPFIELLILFKYLKPAALLVIINHLLGQQLLKDIYYSGTHNFKFMSETKCQLVTVMHPQAIVHDIQEIMAQQRIIQIRIISEGSPALLSEISKAQTAGYWLLVQGLPKDLNILLNILTIVKQVHHKHFKLWVTVNTDLPYNALHLKMLLKVSHRIHVNQPNTLKETISSLFQNEISAIIKGEPASSATKLRVSKEKVPVINLNSFVELRNTVDPEDDNYSLMQFVCRTRAELKYNLYFTVSLLKKMNRYSCSLLQHDVKVIIDQSLKCLRHLGGHPFVFFYKLLVGIHLDSGEIMQQFMFQMMKILIFKQEQQQTLIQNDNEFSTWQIYMFKTMPGEDDSGQIAKFLSMLPESGPNDLLGESIAKETEHHYQQSLGFMRTLNSDEPRRQLGKEQLLQEVVQSQLQAAKNWLQRAVLSQVIFELQPEQWISLEAVEEEEIVKKTFKSTKLNKMVRNKVMNEIKKNKDIKITSKAFTKTLQEQTLKQTDNVLHQFLVQDRDRFHYFRIKDGKANLYKQTLINEAKTHVQRLNTIDYQSPHLVDEINLINDHYHYLVENITKPYFIHDLHRMYNPAQLLYSFMLMKSQEMKIPFNRLRIRCDRSPSPKEFQVQGMMLVNAHLNIANDQLEEGNTFSEELPLPTMRLKVVAKSPEHTQSELCLEFDDKLHLNIALEHQKQMAECLQQKEVDFSRFLSRKADSPRTCIIKNLYKQKQEQNSKKIYFIKLPIRWKGGNVSDGAFYFKSLLSQHNWVHKNAYVTN